jgi:hypothetical protein
MSDYFDRVERQIVQRVEAGLPRSTRRPSAGAYLAVAAAALVVIVVAGAFLLARGSGGGGSSPPESAAGAKVVFTLPRAASSAVVERSAAILRGRLHAAVPGAQVSVANGAIVVTPPNGHPGVRNRILTLAAPGVLTFYDWEGEVLAPNGKTVGSQLPSPSPALMDISQGNGPAAPGMLGAGCVPLQQAIALARKAGARLPLHTEIIGHLRFRVPVLYAVLQAAPTHPGGPTDGYFVVRINGSLITDDEITSPRVSTDRNSRAANVEFGFTATGRRAFEALTKAVARRGSEVSGLGQTLNQHFAIVLDNRVISVPFIDYKTYPDGINGSQGADISGNFTRQSARDLAILLRYGPLPVALTATG